MNTQSIHTQKRTRLYILDTSKPYTGNIENIVDVLDGQTLENSIVSLTDKTWLEYNAFHGGKMKAIDWGTFDREYNQPHRASLMGSFKECSEDSFIESLNCLPPIKWRKLGNWDTFYLGECYTMDLYSMYAKNLKTGKCYSALRSVHADPETIIDELNAL